MPRVMKLAIAYVKALVLLMRQTSIGNSELCTQRMGLAVENVQNHVGLEQRLAKSQITL